MNEEFKIWMVSLTGFFFTAKGGEPFRISLTDITDLLRILLLVISIGYSGYKFWKLLKNDKTNDN